MTDDAAYRPIGTRGEFHDALREALDDAARTGCRELWMADEDFADWPLSERAVVEQLTRWAQAHRRLTVVARHFDEFPRRHARWTEWRRQWSHVVECRSFEDAAADEIPTLLLADGLVGVRLVDRVRFRGSVSREAADLVRMREGIDAVTQRSVAAFPATILGL
jgi:hypothetical protein